LETVGKEKTNKTLLMRKLDRDSGQRDGKGGTKENKIKGNGKWIVRIGRQGEMELKREKALMKRKLERKL
jgi:hypothetical protein